MLRPRLAFAALVLVVGCATGDPEILAPVLYDTCQVLNDCVEAATRCEELAVEFAGLDYINAICTTGCSTTGALSPDCSRAFVGRAGSCYPADVAGGTSNRVCFEPCDSDDDCLFGFRCLNATDFCGRATSCPIDDDDAICVPGPN
jgi:hypothetical protein